MSKKFLVFSAHPDDLDFGAGGTIAKLTHQGNELFYCIVTNGERGIHKLKISKQKIIKIRKKEQKRAAKILGVKKVIFLDQIDGEIEHTKTLRKKLVRVVREVKPDIVISFDPASLSFDHFGRYHRDHRIVAEVVFDALYPAAGSYAFFTDLRKEPHSIKEAWFFATNLPNLWVNISRTINKKIEALLAHQSQMVDEKMLRKRIFGWARQTGKKKKMRYAEAFRRMML